MIRRLAPLFSLCLALACGAPTGTVERFEYGAPFRIRLGQSSLSADGGTVVTFERIVTDSRCPTRAVCVWEGEAIVALRVWATPGTSFDRMPTLRAAATGGPGTDSSRAGMSFAPPDPVDVKVGSDAPVAVDGRQVEALGLDRTGPPASRHATLRIVLLTPE